jgi:hypothetical protein
MGRKPYTSEQLSVHYKDIQSIINLKQGEHHVVENYSLKSLRVMLNRFLRGRVDSGYIDHNKRLETVNDNGV